MMVDFKAFICQDAKTKSAVIWQKGLSHGFTISKISRKTTLKFETKKAIELYLYIAQKCRNLEHMPLEVCFKSILTF